MPLSALGGDPRTVGTAKSPRDRSAIVCSVNNRDSMGFRYLGHFISCVCVTVRTLIYLTSSWVLPVNYVASSSFSHRAVAAQYIVASYKNGRLICLVSNSCVSVLRTGRTTTVAARSSSSVFYSLLSLRLITRSNLPEQRQTFQLNVKKGSRVSRFNERPCPPLVTGTLASACSSAVFVKQPGE